MLRLALRLALLGALFASALPASRWAVAAPIAAPGAVQAAIAGLTIGERVQFMHLGRPYCWYPYGWAGAGWYWCGYGTRYGLGWGGVYGWNGWVAPRSSRVIRHVPKYRFRRL